MSPPGDKRLLVPHLLGQPSSYPCKWMQELPTRLAPIKKAVWAYKYTHYARNYEQCICINSVLIDAIIHSPTSLRLNRCTSPSIRPSAPSNKSAYRSRIVASVTRPDVDGDGDGLDSTTSQMFSSTMRSMPRRRHASIPRTGLSLITVT